MKLNGKDFKFNVIDCKLIYNYLESLGKEEYVNFRAIADKFGFTYCGLNLNKVKKMLPKNYIIYGKRVFFSSEKNIKILNKLISNIWKDKNEH